MAMIVCLTMLPLVKRMTFWAELVFTKPWVWPCRFFGIFLEDVCFGQRGRGGAGGRSAHKMQQVMHCEVSRHHLRLVDRGILCLGPPCSLWIPTPQSVHGRYESWKVMKCNETYWNPDEMCRGFLVWFFFLSPSRHLLRISGCLATCASTKRGCPTWYQKTRQCWYNSCVNTAPGSSNLENNPKDRICSRWNTGKLSWHATALPLSSPTWDCLD